MPVVVDVAVAAIDADRCAVAGGAAGAAAAEWDSVFD